MQAKQWLMVVGWAIPLLLGGCATHSRTVEAVSLSSTVEELVVTGSRSAPAVLPDGPVYNAILTEAERNAPNLLHDEEDENVAFYIGSNSSGNILNSPNLSQEAKHYIDQAEKLKRPIEFTVALACNVCEDEGFHPEKIVFDPLTDASTVARWNIRPEISRARDNRGVLQFVITYEGEIHDVRSADVRFAENAAGTRAKAAPSPSAGASPPLSKSTTETSCPMAKQLPRGDTTDLIIWAHGSQDAAQLSFTVLDPDLASKLGTRLNNEDGQVKAFDTGAPDWTELGGYADQAYRNLTAVVLRQPALAPGWQPQLSEPGNFSLSPNDKKAATAIFYDIGARLYSRLIYKSADPALAEVLGIIEEYGKKRKDEDRPLNIRIISREVYLPWQMLHAVDDSAAGNNGPDPEAFWGTKFILSVYPILPSSCGQAPARQAAPKGARAIFLKYVNPGETKDEVAAISSSFETSLRDLLDNDPPLTPVSSVTAAHDALRDGRQSISLIVGYSHGFSGTTYTPVPGGGYAMVSDAGGPQLILSKTEKLRSDDLASWSYRFGPANPYLAGRPIVLLDGCETGSVGAGSYMNGAPFQQVFLEDGARAVVVTEASVWSYFGYGFGLELLDNLNDGASVARALYDARLAALRINNNPFGLLFSLYGNGSAKLSQQGGP